MKKNILIPSLVVVLLSTTTLYQTSKVKELAEEVIELENEIVELQSVIRSLKRVKKEKPKEVSRGIQVPSHRNFKSYMDYRAITNKQSKQYKLQQKAKTEKGFRMIDGKYLIALGSYWGKVGDEVLVTIGETKLPCIIGDQKADIHTDENNMFHLSDGSVIEFIVDTRSLSQLIKKMGDCSYAEHIDIRGNVLNISNVNM